MLMKIIFITIDCLAVLGLYFITKAAESIRKSYGLWLRKTLYAGIVAISANILIAVSVNAALAQAAFCIYFTAINWILYYLVGFCLAYTDHERTLNILYIPAACILGLDSLSIILNPFFSHEFSVYRSFTDNGGVFFQINARFPYYIHLALDYTAVLIALFFIIYRIARSYSFYRTKYIIILSVLILIVGLNVVYMMFALPLDASVVFYAIAGMLIYFSTQIFVPQSLMMSSIGHAVDDMNEGLILFDISDNCIYANAFSVNRFDIDPESYDLSCEPVSTVIRELSENGMNFGEGHYTAKSRSDNDCERHYNIRYNKLSDGHGRMVGSYFLIDDNTEQEQYLAQIKTARDEADEASRAKSTFLANMSHEIRTPLNSVLGMNEMILRSADDPQILEYAQNIRVAGDTLLGLINDVLDFSKIEANRLDVIESDYNPHDLLRECLSGFEQMAEEKELYIRTECEETMPSVLKGDRKLIRQVMTNIISNALKYTKVGGVIIKMSCEDKKGRQTTLVISVSDTGMGISKKDIENMFDAFKRVNEKENASIQGTGLGLAITKELITLMNGDIFVDSTVDKGSTFTVRIPQQISDERIAGKFSRFSKVEETGYHESFTAENANILVVDDSSMNLKVVQALLRKTKIRIDTATGGIEAISMCNDTKYDVILLDHRMPEPDGIETYKQISSKGANTDTPVIMLTANVISGIEDEYKKIGFAGYLSKPIHSNELESILIKFIPDSKIIRHEAQ